MRIAPGSADEIKRFHELQARLADQFVGFSDDPTQLYTAVVVPSQSVDPVELAKIPGVAHYEERSLFNLMLLRHPRLRAVFVTSKPINPLIVDYYLHQMRGVPSEHARRRLTLLDCDDASPRPLTQKILERPRLVERIRDAIVDPAAAHLAVFNSSRLERTLATRLGIPLNACDPDLAAVGTKTGSRRAFAEAEIPMAPGREGIHSVDDLAEAVADLAAEHPTAERFVVKLDDSFSGEGNAIIDLPIDGDRSIDGVRARIPALRFAAEGQTWEAYEQQLQSMGGICELWLDGETKASPSVQLRINPLREVQVVSTHDQVLGGPGGQVFLGATFPASQRVRLTLHRLGIRVGQVLANKGVIGRFGVDFVVVDDAVYAVEINLRQGGTTHPFNMLKFLTDGTYDPDTGVFNTRQGQPRCYFATDTIRADRYRGILPFDLLNELVLHGTHFRTDETGVVFHLLGCLSEYGKLGCTAIAPTVEEARALYDDTLELLERMAEDRAR